MSPLGQQQWILQVKHETYGPDYIKLLIISHNFFNQYWCRWNSKPISTQYCYTEK
jgi:hypothetical protein